MTAVQWACFAVVVAVANLHGIPAAWAAGTGKPAGLDYPGRFAFTMWLVIAAAVVWAVTS